MKRKRSRLAEVHIPSPSDAVAPLPPGSVCPPAFTVRLPEGASILVPAGFDPDELILLLAAVQEALA